MRYGEEEKENMKKIKVGGKKAQARTFSQVQPGKRQTLFFFGGEGWGWGGDDCHRFNAGPSGRTALVRAHLSLKTTVRV